ncbi:hypothetical protein ACJDT4_00300 [Clostridium neuense]|uniref:LXG domain-containing protein n=1 Tax=Clostridium neuense TaxID=1728934 RepID=A0ABW8T8U1_9CLOT
MSKIEIDISSIRRSDEELRQNNFKLSSISCDIFQSMCNVDASIQARRNIGQRLKNAYDESIKIAKKLVQLEKFISSSMDRYEKAEIEVEKESAELRVLWDLRIRTLTELKSMAEILGTSSAYVSENSKMFYGGEKVGDDEELDEESEELNEAFLSAVNKSDGESSDELIKDIEKHKKSIFDTFHNFDKEAEDLVDELPNKLEMAWKDIKYVFKSVCDNPIDFMVGAGVSIPDNLTYKGVFGLDGKLETMEFNLESNKDYEGLTAIKAGQSGGDILTALLGGTITSAGFTTDAEGVVLAVPTAGTVTVPLEAVGATEVAVGGEITTRSLAGLGDDLDSTFQFADKGEATKINNMNEFFETSFGSSVKNDIVKTKNKFQGQPIYEVTKKVDNQYLKKGDKIYLDNLHKDHLEVFDKKGNAKAVLNLDGTLNYEKTEKVLSEKRKLKIN